MTVCDPQAASRWLLERRAAHRLIDVLPDGLAPHTEADGIAIQHALALLAGAVPPAGFKVGATAARMQEYLGVSAPVGGFMARTGLHHSGATLRFDDFLRPGVECELAVRLAADLPPGPCSREQAAAAVGDLMCGIEIVENRYTDMMAVGVLTMLADQMFHAAAVPGELSVNDWRSLDLVALTGRISIDGSVVGEGVGGDLLGHPMASLAWLAASPLAQRFGGLKAGQVIMLGSVTPPIWLDGPCTAGVVFPPLPPVWVRFV